MLGIKSGFRWLLCWIATIKAYSAIYLNFYYWSPFPLYRISNQVSNYDVITHPCPNAVEVCVWMCNYIPLFTWMLFYLIFVSQRVPDISFVNEIHGWIDTRYGRVYKSPMLQTLCMRGIQFCQITVIMCGGCACDRNACNWSVNIRTLHRLFRRRYNVNKVGYIQTFPSAKCRHS